MGTKAVQPEKAIRTLSGIPVKPFYGPEDVGSDPPPPGQYPYTRGIHPTMYSGRLWTMRQFSGFSTPEKTNERYRYLLNQGQTGLSVAFDLPTLMGYDADQPQAAGEVGKCGVSISSLRDMEILFSGIPLGEVSVSMTINSPAPILFAMYLAVAEQQGVAFESLQGTLQNDILKEYIAQKEYIFPPKPSMRFASDVIEYTTRHVPKYNPISISGYHIREAGSTAVQELAFTLRDGIEYVEWALERGLSIDEFGPRLSFFFNAHNDFFEEIAKYRAARDIWARITKDRFGSKSEKVQKLRFHAQTAGCSLTWQQPLNNVVRTAVQAMAAVMGGTQSLHTNSLDEAYALPSEHAVRLALRTQQILACETGVASVPDPFGGSYYVEALTADMVRAAERYIVEIDAMGGVLPAIERGFLQNEIARASYEYQQEIDQRERIQVGVNVFVEDGEEPLELLAIDGSAEQEQRVVLERLRRERDTRQVATTLERLKHDAEREVNLMPGLLDAVKAYATLGEIVGVLKGVFGVYAEPARI
jgi:methylmalonyl-CoA mutase, N-terminal domain